MKAKEEIITQIDNLVGNYTANSVHCVLCGSLETKFRINKYKLCKRDWELLGSLMELKHEYQE